MGVAERNSYVARQSKGSRADAIEDWLVGGSGGGGGRVCMCGARRRARTVVDRME